MRQNLELEIITLEIKVSQARIIRGLVVIRISVKQTQCQDSQQEIAIKQTQEGHQYLLKVDQLEVKLESTEIVQKMADHITILLHLLSTT